MADINIILPKGALGRSSSDSLLDSILRSIAEQFSPDPKAEWAEKYGTEVNNDVFVMHPYCWCEKPNCPYCFDFEEDEENNEPTRLPTNEMIEKYGIEKDRDAPNFWYKPLNFKVWWYKYIGRGVEMNFHLTKQQLAEMLTNCLSVLQNDKVSDTTKAENSTTAD